jgi:hypothetical protein
MAVRLEDARKTVRLLFESDYAQEMVKPRALIRAVMDKRRCSELQAVLFLEREAPMPETAMLIMLAAALDEIEARG